MQFALYPPAQAEEKRVVLTPEYVARLTSAGHTINILKGYGKGSSITDTMYKDAGANIAVSESGLLKDADVVLSVGDIKKESLKHLKSGSTVIGVLQPHNNQALLKDFAKNKINSISLELIPRITRAQSMDILSSQSNLAGYRAVIEGAYEFNRALPMMMTAAGTVKPAKVLVLGAGVAGLQAIATAKRLGAIVSAFDVRSAAKEQVESLGATFVEVESVESGDASGGYAKEMSEEYKKAQAAKLHDTLKTQDIVITTAQIPGRSAPILITKSMLADMQAGSIIVDLAIDTGGNTEGIKPGISESKNGVKIVAHVNMPSRIAINASQLFSKNVYTLLELLMGKELKDFTINLDDEILQGACLTHQGKIIHPKFIQNTSSGQE